MKELLVNPYLLFVIGGIVGIAIGFAYARFSLPPSSSICSGDFTQAKSKIISIARAEEIYESYSRIRVPLIKEAEGSDFNPTRFGSLKFDVMKNYVDYLTCINTSLKSKGINGIESIRVYFANYPDQFENGDEMLSITRNGDTHSYARRNTFFILPTIIDENDNEKGFKISGDLKDFDYQPIDDFLKSETNKSLRDSEHGSLILNEVALTPPPPGSPTDF